MLSKTNFSADSSPVKASGRDESFLKNGGAEAVAAKRCQNRHDDSQPDPLILMVMVVGGGDDYEDVMMTMMVTMFRVDSCVQPRSL